MKYSIPLLLLGSALPVAAEQIEHLQVSGQRPETSLSYRLDADKLVMEGPKLEEQKAATLGDTLKLQPGLNSSFFGTSAGRPQIRGLGGQRVLIGLNGLGVRDMSSISDDQLIPVEPFLADSISVIKGPAATILYGGEAIAGLVELQDGRIPLEQATSPLQGKLELQTGYNADQSLMSRLQGGNERLVFNLNLLHRERSDYHIPGFSKDRDCKDWSQIVGDSRLADQCQVVRSQPDWEWNGSRWVDATPVERQQIRDRSIDSFGRVDNSSLYMTSGSLGASLLGDNSLLGASVGYTESNRGIPGFMHLGSRATDTLEQTGDIRIHSKQLRFDGLYQYRFSDQPWLQDFNLATVYSRQEDDEQMSALDVNGFELNNWQLNPKLSYQLHPRLPGALGLQWEQSQHQGSGVDNYLPEIDTKRQAAFLLQDILLGPVSVQLGGRLEKIDYQPDLGDYQPGRGAGANIKARDFHLKNYSATLRWDISSLWWLRTAFVHAERAPAVNELYASNPHFALLIEEQGNSDLKTEQSDSLSLSTGFSYGGFSASASWYQNKYQDFIYLGNTGVSRGGVYVREWRQADTDNEGMEAEVSYRLPWQRFGDIELSAFIDRVKNQPVYRYDGSYNPFDFQNPREPRPGEEKEYWRRTMEGSSMPRMPASRQGAELRWQYGDLRASINYIHYDKQDKVAYLENPSRSYGLLGAYLGIEQNLFGLDSEWFIRLDNLTDEDARPHNSFLRYLAPLPGRSVAVGFRAKF